MSQGVLEEILQRVGELSADERRQLGDRLVQLAAKPVSEAEFEKQLEESGFATLPRRPPGWETVPRHPPVEISGEPLSETILQDRR